MNIVNYRVQIQEKSQTRCLCGGWQTPEAKQEPLFQPIYVVLRLLCGSHIAAPMQRKLNSIMAEVLVPNQLVYWNPEPKGDSND